MQEFVGSIWDHPCTVLCITTNPIIRSDGALVMGRGIAKQCVDRNPGVQFKFGDLVKRNGNVFQITTSTDNMRILALFPVKDHWKEQAKLSIIEESAIYLANLATLVFFRDSIFALPRPGCGNGGLDWGKVKPLIEPILPDNVHIIYNGS